MKQRSKRRFLTQEPHNQSDSSPRAKDLRIGVRRIVALRPAKVQRVDLFEQHRRRNFSSLEVTSEQ